MQAIAVRVAVVNFKTLEDQVLAKTGGGKGTFRNSCCCECLHGNGHTK